MPAPDIGTGNDGSQQMLNDAYAQARQSLHGTVPDGLLNNLTRNSPPPGAVAISAGGGGQTDEPPPGSVSSDQPPAGATNPFDKNEPPPEALPVADTKTHGNGDFWSLSTMRDFLRDEFQGTGEELKKALPRAGAKVGQFATFGLAGTAAVADHIANVLTGDVGTPTADKVFDFSKDYIEPAIEHWTPERASTTGQGAGSGGGAQVLGQTAEFVPKMLFGGAGATEIAAEAGINTAKGGVDQGHSLRTAAAEGAVDAVANGIQAMIPGAGLPLVKRVLVQVPAGDMAAVAGDYAKKKILESAGHQKAADEIDPLANLGQDTLQNIVFAALGGHGDKTLAKGPLPEGAPLPEAQPIPGQVPPVVKPEAAAPQAAPEPAAAGQAPPAAPAPAIPDKPSAEPARDLQAQFADMNNKATPRTGVLVPKGSEAAAGKTLEQAATQGRVLPLDQGTLVLKNKAELLKAQKALQAGEDPQAVIGRVTGAGEGKKPEQTVVVQGKTPEGAVASEGMVSPAEAPARIEQMVQEGKKPVVTTPEAAVQRRQDEIQAESKVPTEEVAPEPATTQRAIIKTAAGERAVVLEGAAENGQQKVRLLDDEGEPSDQTVTVPAESVKSGSETAPDVGQEPAKPVAEKSPAEASPAATPEPKSSEKTTSPMLDQLRDAAEDFEKSQQPAKGRKYSGSVKDRAQDVSGFARVLKAVAEKLPGKANPTDIQIALRLAKRAEHLDLKSEEVMAKGQGIGHTELSVHAENMLNAAKRLLNPEHEYELKEPRQEKLKRKVAEKKIEPEAKREPAKPAEKVKVMEDIPDETKPRELTKGEQIKLKQAGDRLIKARDEDADARAADVERILKEIHGDRMSDDDRSAFMSYLMGERRDRLRPKAMDEEIDEELGHHGIDYRTAERGDLESRVLGAHEVSPEMAALHANLERSGMYPKMREAAKQNLQYNARGVLEHMASVTKAGPLRDFISKLAAHQPEGTNIRPVERIISTTGNPMDKAGGLFQHQHDLIQVLMKEGGDSRLTSTILHEAVHAATVHLAREDPMHPFVRESKRLRQIFENRMRERLGHDVIQQHLDYHRDLGPRPKNLINNLYGLKDHLEFMSEAMSSPKFQQLIAESEAYRHPHEGFLGGAHKLADAIVGTIRRALNMITGREAKLLRSVMRNVEDVMETQRKLDVDHTGVANDLASIADLKDEQPALKDEPRLKGIVGRTGSYLARQFYRANQGKVVPALRRVVLANETHDQIVRSNSHWFGEDNEKNPLRQYDDAMAQKNAIINRHLERTRPIVLARQRLDRATDTALGNIQSDATRWGMDPSKDKADVPATSTKAFNFEERWQDLQDRWNALPKAAREVYTAERDHYAWAQKQLRRTAVDAALDTFTDRDISGAQRSLLYNARTRGDFESLVGSGKLVDVGDRNDSLRKSLQELAAVNHMSGPYFHLGRHGEWVVQVHPDVDENFESQHEAEAYASKVRDMGPGSSAKVAEVGGKWNVEGKAQYVSMHKNRADAQDAADALRAAGHKVGQVTQKVEAESGGALTKAMQSLVSEATQKLRKRGDGPEIQALGDALRGTLVQMVANRSAYAASKLARAGFAGVKGEEMGRNFASHAQSMAWNIGNLATTFKQGESLGHIREMAKRPEQDVSQKVVYKRGAVMNELGKRLSQEVSQYGLRNPTNAVIAKLGYMNFLASPSHTGIYLTQNFTTAFPTAGARWGYAKSLAAFTRATPAVLSPTMRSTFKAARPGEFGADDMVSHVIDAIKQHPEYGKYAPQLRELMDRGIITNTFAHEVGHQATGGNPTVQRVFDYARIMPQMAEVYNRVSSGLAALELTGGNIQKAADFINETHVNYAQTNKTRVGKWLAKVPGGNSVTMFHTYVQGMRHLLYSNIKNMVIAETKSRAEAAKTVAGLVVAMSLTAGVIKGAALEPLRGAVWAYNKVFGDDNEFFSLDNSIRRFVSSATGNKTISDAITGGLPRLLGFDLSNRMGLSDLFLHNPPDLWSADTKTRMAFLGEQLGGPMGQMVGEQLGDFQNAMARGDVFGMVSSVVPVKQLRDEAKAEELADTGKRAANGAKITKPSEYDAMVQRMGFKPATVAQAQERQGDVAEYKEFILHRKEVIMGAWAKLDPSQRSDFRKNTIAPFNRANPGSPIKVQDLIKQQRNALRSEQRIGKGIDKDPNIKKLLNY